MNEAKKINESFHNSELNSSKIKKGDILITMAGTNGKVALFDKDIEANINQAIAKLEIKEDIVNAKYLVKYLNSYFGNLNFKKLQHEVSQPNINLEEIKKIKVILPSLKIQQKIVKSIEEYEDNANKFKIEEDLNISINEIFSKKVYPDKKVKDGYFFKKSEIPTESFYIFLDEEDRLDFPFFTHESIFLQMRNENHILLKDICKNPIQIGEQPTYSETGIKVLKTVNLKKNCLIDYENVEFVSKEFYEKKQQAHVKKGDLVVSSAGYGSIGKVSIYEKEEPSLANHKLIIISLNEAENPYFICYFLQSIFGQIQFDKWISGSSGQIQLYPKEMGEFIIPKLSLNEQNEIVSLIKKENEIIKSNKNKFEEYWKISKDKFIELIIRK